LQGIYKDPKRVVQEKPKELLREVATKRIDKMLDELQRCLGVNQAKDPRDAIQKLNYNANLCGLLLPGAPLADALYADIQESSQAALKWDPLERNPPNPKADISRHAREKDIGIKTPYRAVSQVHTEKPLNDSQQKAMNMVLNDRHRFSLIQGPPGTGKTTTASSIIAGWLKTNRGPVLASASASKSRSSSSHTSTWQASLRMPPLASATKHHGVSSDSSGLRQKLWSPRLNLPFNAFFA